MSFLHTYPQALRTSKSKSFMIHKRLSVALIASTLLGTFASSNCPAESPPYVVKAVEHLDLVLDAIAFDDKPKSWFESFNQLILGVTTNPIQEQLHLLTIELDGKQLTQCDTAALVPKVEEFANSLGGQISKSDSESFDFDDLIKFETVLFGLPYTCDDYVVLFQSISNLNSAVSRIEYELGSQLSSFPAIPHRSKYCKHSNQDSLSK